jgi:hypothetical protein
MRASEKFNRDLKQGKYYEGKAVELFDYDNYHIARGYCKEYDFWFIKDGKKTFVEVKSERYASITNNLAIEFKYKGRPSGINITKADYYAYYILHTGNGTVEGDIKKEECYIIPTNELREIAEKCRIVKGGDGYHSMIYLVHKGLLKKYLHHIEDIDTVDDITEKLEKAEIRDKS